MKFSKNITNTLIEGDVKVYWWEITGAWLTSKNQKRSGEGGEFIYLELEEDDGNPSANPAYNPPTPP